MTEAENPKRKSFLFVNPLQRLLPRAANVQKWSVFTGLLLSSAAAEAKIIYVNQALPAVGDGTTWTTAYKDLQLALKSSDAGDLIYVAKGTYYPDDFGVGFVGGDNLKSFVLKGVKVYGGFVGGEANLTDRDPELNVTTLSGEIWPINPADPKTNGFERYWSLHVVTLSANSTLDGINVKKGRAIGNDTPADNDGGGILVPSGMTVTLNNCSVTECFASQSGAGVSGNVIATNCVFEQNLVNNEDLFSTTLDRASHWLSNPDCNGGAISGGVVTATNCEFNNNKIDVRSLDLGRTTSASGGAIFATTANVKDCTFDGNGVFALSKYITDELTGSSDATSQGGSISVSGTLLATRCKFLNNKAEATSTAKTALATPSAFGGAIAGQVSAINCVFSKNSIRAFVPGTDTNTWKINALGGAVYSQLVSELTNCVFVENKALKSVETAAVNSSPDRTGLCSGGGIFVASGKTILMNSTLLDNTTQQTFISTKLPIDGFGASLGCDGSVNILSNIIWDTKSQVSLIYVGGRSRISNSPYPTPSTETINIVKGSSGSLKSSLGASVDFGEPPARTIPDSNPVFADITNPIGPDGKWGTADDGLRILAASPAVDKGNPLFIPKDPYDLDGDGNLTENIPADFAGFRRVQDGKLDLGAYEFGNTSSSPDISVELVLPVTVLVDGAAIVPFGAGRGTTKTFVIKNTGAGDLFGISITRDGSNFNQFTVTPPTVDDLVGGGSTTFSVTFNPTVSGPVVAALHIASNDPDESPFDIQLTGDAQVPDIAVDYPVGVSLTDAESVIDYQVVGAQSSAVRTITIKNTGVASLKIASITSSGANAANFVVTGPLATVIASGASTTFNVTFAPNGPGLRTANINIVSDDPDAESTFLLKVVGSGSTSPEIAISQPFASDLVDGGTTSFGSVKKGLLLSKKFVIRNAGNAPLTNLAIATSGSGMFAVTKLTTATLAPGATTSFKVTFKPSTLGKKTAKIIISSNDLDESQFDMNLSGTGVASSSAKKRFNLAASTETFSPNSGTTSGTGVVSTTQSQNGLKYLVLTVTKPAGSNLGTGSTEVSSNLVDWYSGVRHTTTLVDSATLLQVRDNTPVEAGKKRYIRLK